MQSTLLKVKPLRDSMTSSYCKYCVARTYKMHMGLKTIFQRIFFTEFWKEDLLCVAGILQAVHSTLTNVLTVCLLYLNLPQQPYFDVQVNASQAKLGLLIEDYVFKMTTLQSYYFFTLFLFAFWGNRRWREIMSDDVRLRHDWQKYV